MSETLVDSLHPDALGEGEFAAWRRMLEARPDLSSPFFRPEFTRVAGSVTPHAAVAVFSQAGRITGFFPYQRRGRAILPLAAPLADYHGVISAPGEGPGLEEAARLLKAPRFSVSSWIDAPEADGRGVDGRGSGETRRTLQAVLPSEGFDAWYAERRAAKGKFFKDKERARRSLESERGPIRVESGLADPALLDRLIALKREQYRRSRLHDVFDCGWTVDLLRALMGADAAFAGSLAALWAGDDLCAIEYSLMAADQCHFWFPVYEPSAARCSPGILLSLDTMRLEGGRGRRVFDFGFEGEHYKSYFANVTRTVREVEIARSGVEASAGRAAMAALGLAGEARARRLRTSLRRRWAAIEACEITAADRLRGAAGAAVAALARARPARADA